MDKIIKDILIKHNFSFKKAFGQNFLSDDSLLSEIVDKSLIDKNSNVLEIGCGAGTLTKILSNKAKFVLGYEIDQTLKPVLSDVLSDSKNVEIIFKDIMKEDLSIIDKKFPNGYHLVANLPYYITSPLIMRFIENKTYISSMSIMVQEEVAKRLCAKEGTADYGAITVAINLRGSAKIIQYVNREKFTPSPNVDSAVVKIDIDRNKNKDVDFIKVKKLVRCAFNNRRKMFINNLMKDYNLGRDSVEKIFNLCDIPLTCRGEILSSQKFVELSNYL